MLSGQELLHTNLVLADGAMGTYFSHLSGLETRFCEESNIESPDIIRRIHREYIDAGATLLRTNTFAAASRYDSENPGHIAKIVSEGWRIATESAADKAYVAADIGPVYGLEPELASRATQFVVDTFIDSGAEIFLFETFADPAEIICWSNTIRLKVPHAVIVASFAVSADGYTRKGIALDRLAMELDQDKNIDIWGINCSIGPNHMLQLLSRLPAQGKPLSLMPNSGYPHLEDGRLLFGSSPDYFAQTAIDLRSSRTKIIGGCCGTTPLHLAALSSRLSMPIKPLPPAAISKTSDKKAPAKPSLARKLAEKNFICLCELDPPRGSDLNPLMLAAHKLKNAGIDGITIADSPLARVKLDSVTCAARIIRETDQVALPHLCCRDRNVNSLRSALLAAHSEGLRQILAITGDAIPESDTGFVKPVFNLNSSGLLNLVSQMNQDVFAEEPMFLAAALDPGVKNVDVEFKRAIKKMQNGAGLFLTQPIYDHRSLELVRRLRHEGARILVGLMPLISFRNARFMSQEVPGIRIPDHIIARFNPDQTADEAIQLGIDIAFDLALAAKEDADGFYFIAPFNRAEIIADLILKLQKQNIIV